MRRRHFITFAAAAAASRPLAARAQQNAPIRRIGMVMLYDEHNPETQALLAAFRDGLATLGWSEGRNISIDYRWVGTDAERMRVGTQELVASNPDIIVAPGSPTTALLLKQTHTIPIIFVQIIDPVAQGFVASLSRPGGNATGLVNLETSMTGKWIALLKEIVPKLTRIAVPFNPASAPYAELYLNYFRSAAPGFGVQILTAPVADLDALQSYLSDLAQDAGTAVIPMPSAFSTGHAAEIAALLERARLPGLYVVRAFAKAGGLISYGNSITDNFRQAAGFVDRILRGEKPSDLPVQFPTKFELVINLKTARSFGLTVPLTLQASADEVIE